MSETSQGPVSEALVGEAAAWFARLHSDQVTREDERAFAEWLDADPSHKAAYDEAAAMWGSVGALAGEAGMRDLMKHLSPEPEAPRSQARRRWLTASAAASVAVIAAGAIGFSLVNTGRTYDTQFGEQRRVALDDGSTLTLNTETRVRVAFSEHERRIWLERGQAHFIVAPDAARPFRVFVGDQEVRALGTRFEVRRDGADMKVTLEEGSVALFRGAETTEVRSTQAVAEAVLRPGQQAVITPTAAIEIASVDTQRVLAWRFGQMSLDGEPLADAVAEINRYNTRQIVLDDPALAAMPVSGLFQTGSPDAFVEALTTILPIEVAGADDRAIRLQDAR